MIYTKYETYDEILAAYPHTVRIDSFKAFAKEFVEYALTVPDLWVAPDVASSLLATGDLRIHLANEFPDMANNYAESFVGLIHEKTKLYIYERVND